MSVEMRIYVASGVEVSVASGVAVSVADRSPTLDWLEGAQVLGSVSLAILWDGIGWLLRESGGDDFPFNFLYEGDVDLAGGSGHLFEAERALALLEMLRDLNVELVLSRFDGPRMDAEDVYPMHGFWLGDDAVSELRQALAEMARLGQTVSDLRLTSVVVMQV